MVSLLIWKRGPAIANMSTREAYTVMVFDISDHRFQSINRWVSGGGKVWGCLEMRWAPVIRIKNRGTWKCLHSRITKFSQQRCIKLFTGLQHLLWWLLHGTRFILDRVKGVGEKKASYICPKSMTRALWGIWGSPPTTLSFRVFFSALAHLILGAIVQGVSSSSTANYSIL